MSKEHATKTTAKKVTTYPDDLLDTAMARIRVGETQSDVARTMYVDATKFGRALRERYPTEYPALIAYWRRQRLNRLHGRAQPLTITPRPAGAGYVGYIDKEDERDQDVMAESPRGFVRGMAEFTAMELVALTAKLRQWVQSGAGRPSGGTSRQEAG